MGGAPDATMAIVFVMKGMGLLSEVASSWVRPCTNEEDTIGVDVKLLVVRIVSRDLSTISLNMCGGALTPSTKEDSNSHVVGTQLSLW